MKVTEAHTEAQENKDIVAEIKKNTSQRVRSEQVD